MLKGQRLLAKLFYHRIQWKIIIKIFGMFKESTSRHICQDIFYIFHWGEPIGLSSLNQWVDPDTCGSPFRAACKQPVLSPNYEWTDTVLGKGIADTAMSIFQIIEEFLTAI